MSTMLSTPSTEHAQQRVETDWTPIKGYDSEEDASKTEQNLAVINESIDALAKCSDEGRTSPLTCQMQTTWEETGKEARKAFVRKAKEACMVVCMAIAPEDGARLFKAVCQDGNPDIEKELQPLLSAYKNAPTKEAKTQILSIYADSYPAKKLIEVHTLYDPITEWQIRKAKLHAKNNGPGAPLEKPVFHRVRLDMVKVEHLLDFINRPYFHQDVAYGTRTLKLSSGEKLVMPNVVRTVTRSTMLAQYWQYCSEEEFEPLSRATLYRILEVREASQRKALQGLDNVAADGATAFNTIEKIVDELEKAGADPEWSVNVKEKLNDGKKYLKTNYKVHCKEDGSPCADHCRAFALSDPSIEAFKQECNHQHNLQCDMCEGLKLVVGEIENSLQNEKGTLCFYSTEQQGDLLYDFLQAKKDLFDWKAHILRSENQEQAKNDVLSSLDHTTALITMDWAMKFQCRKFREKQAEWFGKKGLSWHVSSVILKSEQAEEPVATTYVHLFDSCTQDWFAVASILENLLVTLKAHNPSVNSVHLKSDEAGCYHNNLLIASIHDVSKRVGIAVETYYFSEPQHGKDICDRIICPMKLSVRKYCDEGHDIQSVKDMRGALLERPVKGVTVAVGEVIEGHKTTDVTKIPHFSMYHNFEFLQEGIRVQKAYSVGPGEIVNYDNIIRIPQGPTSLEIKDGQDFSKIDVTRGLKNKQPTQTNTSELFPCPQEGCSQSFKRFDALQHHLDCGQHGNEIRQESFYDQLRRDWAARFSTLLPENRPRPKPLTPSTADASSLPMGWALQKPRPGGIRYSEKVRDYLKTRFDAGEQSGRKADPNQVVLDMRNARTAENERLFMREEWLSKGQIQSYFSRLAVLKRKQASKPETTASDPAESLDIEELVEEEIRLQQVEEVYEKMSVQHPIYYDSFNLCELHQNQKISSFNVSMLKSICSHFEISFKSKERKSELVGKLTAMISECSCSSC